MAVPKRKTSKMKKRQRKAANRYKGVQVTYCKECGAPVKPHRLCIACGMYNGQQVLAVSE
jgi:large subunit ribosomal protein L32